MIIPAMLRRMAAVSLLGAGLVLAGCTAYTFSGLQNDFGALLQRKAGSAAACADDKAGLDGNCLADFPSLFAAIAADSIALADDADDVRTRIGALRLAAQADWQAGTEESRKRMLDTADRGATLCRDGKGGPRDCALLMVLPALAQQNADGPKIDSFSATWSGKPPTDKFVTGLRDLAADYYDGVWRVLRNRQPQICRLSGLAGDVTAYLRRQERIVQRAHDKLNQLAAKLPGGTVPLDDSHCTPGASAPAGVYPLRVQIFCHNRAILAVSAQPETAYCKTP